MTKKVAVVVIIIVVVIGIFTGTKVLSKEKEENSSEVVLKKKLKKLNNIDQKISYFKYDYIDRYISYKDKNKKLQNSRIVLEVNMGLDKVFYTGISPSPNQNNNFVLVNKFYYLDENYVPEKLEEIDNKYSASGKYLVNVARISFESLAKKAIEEGLEIRAVSAYRDYSYQTSLYDNYVKQDGVGNADKYSARPGFSEHQTGLAVDVDNKVSGYNNFENTKEFTWMRENAHKYGFILRYPKDKEYITGYIYEPWHYRYVGIDIATFIYKNNLTFEEYYFMYIDK